MNILKTGVLPTWLALFCFVSAVIDDREQPHDAADSQQAVTEFFAGRLMMMHHNTILMSDFAAREASDDVKSFANKLHESHAELNRKLAELAPNIVAVTSLDSSGKPDESGQPGTPPVDNKSDAASGNKDRKSDNHPLEAHSDNPLHQILNIERRATQNYLQASTQMLSKYKGQDFDMGFLGFQIGAHT